MEIRRSLPQDADEISLAESLIFSDAWSKSDVLSAICTAGSMCYTALADGRVAAYIIGRVIEPEGEIYRLATLPEYRRRGYAYRLLDYAVKSERALGLEVLFLEVREANAPARGLYGSYGFKEIGIRKNYYRNPDDNAVVMQLCHEADLEI